MKSIALFVIFAAFAVSQAFAQSPPCPSPTYGVEAVCLPLPGTAEAQWKQHTRIFQVSEHCFIEMTYCVQWVCRGHAGLSRSRISISKFRQIYTGVGGGDDFCGPEFDPQDPFFQQKWNAYLQDLINELIAQDAFLHDGRPKPCSQNPTDALFEVITTPCVAQGFFQGRLKLTYADQSTFTDNLVHGYTFNFCPEEEEGACSRTYTACTNPDGSISTTVNTTGVPGSCPNNYGYISPPASNAPYPIGVTTPTPYGVINPPDPHLPPPPPNEKVVSAEVTTTVFSDYKLCTPQCD